MTLVPAFCTFSRSGSSAALSVGATISASGLVTSAESISGFCCGTLNVGRAGNGQLDAELLGLGLGAALHRDVEVVALGADDQLHGLLRVLLLPLPPLLEEPHPAAAAASAITATPVTVTVNLLAAFVPPVH